jgi:hypothetical protein
MEVFRKPVGHAHLATGGAGKADVLSPDPANGVKGDRLGLNMRIDAGRFARQDKQGPLPPGLDREPTCPFAESPVLGFVLVLLVVWVVLMVLLSAWTLWFQAYIYSEPVGEIYWRGPAAGTGIMAFVVLWVVMDYRAPGRYLPLHQFSTSEDKRYDELRIPDARGKEEVYRAQKATGGRIEYRNKQGKELPSVPPKVIVTEDGQEHVFLPEKDARGTYKRENGTLAYRDSSGQVMEEGSLGVVRRRHPGWLVLNLFLNFFLLAVCFACLWLLLRFQWPHALGQAIILWGVLLLFVLPMVLTRAEIVARERAAKQLSDISYPLSARQVATECSEDGSNTTRIEVNKQMGGPVFG